MSMKSLAVAISLALLALTQGGAAGAASITRSPSTGITPNNGDFPALYNNHPTQVGYLANTTVDVGANHMFRDSIPIVCEKGHRLTGAGMTFTLVKISDGENFGDNDTLNFWVNGQKRYEFNVGAAATAGFPVTISIDLGALPTIGTGPNTLTAVSTSLAGSPISMIPDMKATQRLSFAIQDDTNIGYARVDYTCEKDPEPLAVNPCCPPWTPALMAGSLQYVGSGSIGAPYTLKFTPSPQLINALQSYLNYANTTNPALTNLLIEFQLYDQGNGLPSGVNGTAVGPVSGMKLTANSTAVQLHTNYNTNTPAIYAGVSTPGTSTTPSSYPMQVGKKYLFHSGMWTDSVDFFDKKTCAEVDVFIRISVIPGARKSPPRTVLEVMDGRRTITIPLDGPDRSRPSQPLPVR